MNLEYVGAESNFTVLAGVSPEYELEFTRDGQPLPVSGVTFDGVLVDADGNRQELVIHHAGLEENVLRVTFPHADKVGRFDYEIAYTTQEGARYRLAYGVLQVLSTELLLEEASGLEFDSRRLQVRLPGVAGGHVQLLWRAGMEIMRAVEEARAAAEKLAGVDETLAQLEAQVEEFRVFVARWKDDLPSVLVMNPVTGTIWVGGVDTGQPYRGQDGKAPRINAYGYWETFDGVRWNTLPYQAIGKDGRDGDSIRRIRLNSVEELPQSGETCNGGYLYYVPGGIETVTRRMSSRRAGESVSGATVMGIVLSAARCWSDEGGVLKRMGVQASSVSNGEPSSELLYAHVYYEDAGAWWYAGRSRAAVAQVANTVSWWEFDGLVVREHCRVKVVFSQTATEPGSSQIEQVRVTASAANDGSGLLTASAGTLAYAAEAFWEVEQEGYSQWRMYAWLEPAGWVCVGERYDFATADNYGLMRYATDVPVVNGAPVGQDANGQARVPLASSTVPGAVLPSSPEVSDVGGWTHMSVSGTLLVDLASMDAAGAVRVSTSEVLTAGGIIGLNAAGQLLVRLATPSLPGAVLPGSSYAQLTRRPYLLSVGVDGQGRLANCLVGNGALQHKLKSEWLALRGRGFMLWMNEADFLVDGAHYMGLVTSGQFDQDEEEGLTLLPATADRLAGVYKVTDPAEATRPAQTVLPLSVTETRYAHADNVYDKATADERFMSTKGGVVSVKLCKVGVDLPTANEQEKGMLYIGV